MKIRLVKEENQYYTYGLFDPSLIGYYQCNFEDDCLIDFTCDQEYDLKLFIVTGLKFIRQNFQYQGIFKVEIKDEKLKSIYEEIGFIQQTDLQYVKYPLKNIIFDNGNVLTTFSPDHMISNYFDDHHSLIKEVVFGSLWNDLDQGIIEEKQALALWKEKIPVYLHSRLEDMFTNWHHYLTPKEEMYEYMLTIFKKYHFYLLSNAGIRHEVFKSQIPALTLMDGMVVSYQLKVNKPDPYIYQYLIEKYHLDPKECVMIDDKEENIEAARNAGMHGFVYHNNLEELKEYIYVLGV